MPRTTLFRPNRKVLCLFDESTASRKMPPKATLAPALVTEGLVHDDPDHAAGDQMGEDQGGQDDPQVVPLPGGGVEDGVGGVVVPPGGQPGGLPDLADGARADADDPAGDQDLERLEDLGAEAIAERRYQRGERGDKLVHRSGPPCGDDPGVRHHPQDKHAAREGPLRLASSTAT